MEDGAGELSPPPVNEALFPASRAHQKKRKIFPSRFPIFS
jgi:hypothetical protein